MDLPRQPTVIPQARRYNRKFYAPRDKSFGGNEKFIIEIPPIDKTYLSKNTKLHFDFELVYQEASSSTWQSVWNGITGWDGDNVTISETEYTTVLAPYADRFFSRDLAMSATEESLNPGVDSLQNAYTKPIPTLDINGAYGLINRISVYDYKGTTLLEDVQEHDVLSAILADFDFKDENIHIHRSKMTDALPDPTYPLQDTTNPIVRKHPCSFFTSDEENAFYKSPISLSRYFAGLDIDDDFVNVYIESAPVTISTKFSLDLYSFLGKFSNKFVPLHNGFRIEFIVNNPEIPISFGTAQGSNRIHYKDSTDIINSMTLDPSIISMKLSNIYLKCDLLELSGELDKGVDKVVHYQGFKYQKDFFPYVPFSDNISDENRPDFVKRIAPAFRSLNKVIIGQRPIYTKTMFPNDSIGKQKLGYRIRNYIRSAELLMNKSVVQSIDNDYEAYEAMANSFHTKLDEYLNFNDFIVDNEEENTHGTLGFQYPFLNSALRRQVEEIVDTTTNKWFPGWGEFDSLSSFYQGKYLLSFDTRLPGTDSEVVGGLDTTKNVLEYKLVAESNLCRKSNIDVFCQHDALLKVDPGKTTTVSF